MRDVEMRMADRTELLEAALDTLPDGLLLIGETGHVAFWNRAAESITGHAGVDLLGRQLPGALQALVPAEAPSGELEHLPAHHIGHGTVAYLQHKCERELPVITRVLVLRDGMGARIGAAALFHPAEGVDTLPHGECGQDSTIEQSQAEVEERLEIAFQEFLREGVPFGVLWITVDQAHELRKTHGVRACMAMLEKVERTLANGLRPAEELGRWGQDEFLVLAHEHTPERLAAHAQTLAGLARTADFRWWGDRVSLTVSAGAAQADASSTLASLLEKARAAMFSSMHGGGNHITLAPGEQSCSPS